MATRIEFNNMNLGLMKHGLDRWFAPAFKWCKFKFLNVIYFRIKRIKLNVTNIRIEEINMNVIAAYVIAKENLSREIAMKTAELYLEGWTYEEALKKAKEIIKGT